MWCCAYIDRECYLAHSDRSCDVKIIVPIRFKSYVLHSIVKHTFDDGMTWISSNQTVMDGTTCFISAIDREKRASGNDNDKSFVRSTTMVRVRVNIGIRV